jgi:hypothetical protein
VTAVRSSPCRYCPYRADCPSGVWAHEEYERLRTYDAPTFAQPVAGFGCHATPDCYCNGWAVVHSGRGHEFELLALRLRWPEGGMPDPVVSFFPSGAAAADHGQAGIETLSDEAIEAIGRLIRKGTGAMHPP